MLREIRDLGFDHAELSHGTRISLLPGIYEAVDAGEIKISSLHNFCPLPMGVTRSAPNIYKLSAERTQERDNAFKYTCKTIETAARLKAPLVVIHYGAMEMKDYTDRLVDMVAKGERDSSKYQKLCDEVMMKRESIKEPFIDRANELLKRVLPVAEKYGIRLGIENREALEELPLEQDYDFLFRELESPLFVYWHDCGHAQIKENLGFIQHQFHLESQAEKLYGFHIHDVQFPGKDHCEPGTGVVNFAGLKPFVKPEHLKVFEFGPSLTPEQVVRGAAYVKSIWGND